MANNLKPNTANYIRPTSGGCIGAGVYGNGVMFDYSAYPFLADPWPMQLPVCFNAQQKVPCPPNGNFGADTMRQQRASVYGAQGPESLQSSYHRAPPRGTQTVTAVRPPASQYEQYRQSSQQQQPNWCMANFPNEYNSQMGQLNNYTPLSPSEAQIWPGYYMMPSPDPNIPFGFGLGPLDIN